MTHRFAFVFLALAACSTTYHPLAPSSKRYPEGYEDKRIGDRRYEITYSTNSPTRRDEALALWRRRANELCPGGYEGSPNIDPRFLRSSGFDTRTLRDAVTEEESPLVQGQIACKV